jgi:hypothetical protein
MKSDFVQLVENTIKENEGTNNLESLFNYLQSVLTFNVGEELETILRAKVTLNAMKTFAQTHGFVNDQGDVDDSKLAQFNHDYRESVGLPQTFGEFIQDDEVQDNEEMEVAEEGLVAPQDPQVSEPVEDSTEVFGMETEGPDLEGRMVKRQMLKTCEYANDIMAMVEDDDQLPSWVQAKLTKVADYIGAVKHYLEAEKTLESKD